MVSFVRRRLSPGLIALLLSAFTVSALAAEQQLSLDQQYQLLDQIRGDKRRLRQAIAAGDARASICRYCHGKVGVSVKDHIPNLAAQQPYYLLRQFQHFADGVRRDYVMQEMAGNLTLEDRINVTLFFTTQSAENSNPPSPLAEQGAQIFNELCQKCHGAQGYGQDEFPRLAGQKAKYVENALNMFATTHGDRRNVMMAQVAKRLSDAQIKAVAAFVSGLK